MINKKICIINHSLTGGGSERVMCNFANLFCENGFEVDLILLSRDPRKIKINKNINQIKFLKKRSIYCIPRLIRYFFKNPDIIIISSQRHINLIVLIAKLIAFSKSKIFVRESTCYNMLIHTEPIIKKYLIKFLTPLLYRFSQKIICPAEDVKIDFLSSYPSFEVKIEKIYNPIDFDSISYQAKIINSENVILPSKFAVTVSRLSPEKNLEFLINSFSKIKTKDLKLLILGEGKSRKNLEEQIDKLNLRNKVLLYGHVKNPYAIVSKALLSLSTSVVEGLPNAILESIALSTPVLALRSISGVEELLKNNKCGYTIDTDDHRVFANKIDEIIEQRIEINLLDEFRQQYSFPQIAHKFSSLF